MPHPSPCLSRFQIRTLGQKRVTREMEQADMSLFAGPTPKAIFLLVFLFLCVACVTALYVSPSSVRILLTRDKHPIVCGRISLLDCRSSRKGTVPHGSAEIDKHGRPLASTCPGVALECVVHWFRCRQVDIPLEGNTQTFSLRSHPPRLKIFLIVLLPST